MEIEVGEYVRTSKGIIGILKSQELTYPEPSEWILDVKGKEVVIVECENYPVKHSFNLIDLLENNDIVLIKTKGTQFVNLGIVRKREDQRSGKLNILVNGQNINEFEILEVLTHEQYEANCYKVKGEW